MNIPASMVSAMLALLLTFPAATLASPPRFTITDLGTLGGPSSGARSLSHGAQGAVVAGESKDGSGDTEGFVWVSGQLLPLGRHGAGSSVATAVNPRAAIALNLLAGRPAPTSSAYYGGGSQAHHFYYGTLTPLGDLGGGASHAWGIDDFDRIVGESLNRDSQLRPFLWAGGRMQELPLPSPMPAAAGVAFDINNHGQIVGWGDVDIGDCCSFIGALLWEQGSVRWLQPLAFRQYAVARAINDSGTVVGYAQDAAFRWRPVAWQKGLVQDLGTLGGAGGRALDINSGGAVVGAAQVASGASRAFWYAPADGMHDLNALVVDLSGWLVLHEAWSVNDYGQIAGLGQRANGETHAFLLTPEFKIIDFPGDIKLHEVPAEASCPETGCLLHIDPKFFR